MDKKIEKREFSDEHIQNLRLSHLGKKLTEEQKRKISNSNKGRKTSEATKDKLRKKHLGKKLSLEHRKKLSISHLGKATGEKNCNWKGGITPINKKIRHSHEYKLWRTAVFERDDYTCIWCGVRGVNLHADHIKPFAYYPELRFAIDNGRTLCIRCHEKTDTYRKKIKVI
jgi:hypothetical protein